MTAYLSPLLQLQRFFIPALLITLAWAVWKMVFKKDLATGLALYLALVVIVDSFLNTGIYLPGLEKGSVRYSEICALFLLMNAPPVSAERQSKPASIGWPIWIYFSLLFVAALRADPVQSGIFDFRTIVVPQVVAFVVARRGLDSHEAYRRFFVGLSILVVIVGLFNFYDVFFDRWLLKSDVLDKGIYAHNRQLRRFGSLFLNPNYLGAFIVLVFPAMFIWTLNERRWLVRLWGAGGLLLLLFSLVQTQSRAPLLGFALALLLLLVGPCGEISRGRRFGVMTAFLLAFAILLPGFYEHATQRFTAADQETLTPTEEAHSRETTWTYTMRIIGEHPLMGIGLGESQFMKAMSAQGFESEFGVESLDAPHNSYLQIAAYSGVPALLVFVFVNLTLLVRAGVAASKSATAGYTTTIFGLAVGIAAFLATVFTDLQLFTPSIAPLYWTFSGLLVSLLIGANQPHSSARPVRAVPGGGAHNPRARPGASPIGVLLPTPGRSSAVGSRSQPVPARYPAATIPSRPVGK